MHRVYHSRSLLGLLYDAGMKRAPRVLGSSGYCLAEVSVWSLGWLTQGAATVRAGSRDVADRGLVGLVVEFERVRLIRRRELLVDCHDGRLCWQLVARLLNDLRDQHCLVRASARAWHAVLAIISRIVATICLDSGLQLAVDSVHGLRQDPC